MSATMSHGKSHSRSWHGGHGHSGRSVQPLSPYWGWSHENQRLEMMDLPTYVDSLRQTYDTALSDLSDRLQSLSTMVGGPGLTGAVAPKWRRTRGGGSGCHRDCGCDQDCGCGGGCGCDRDCGCECCVCDADLVVYSHCGEVRVVPIEVTNDTRRERENVNVEISHVRSARGRELPWEVSITPSGPLTLPPCSRTKLELLVHVVCGEREEAPKPRTARTKEPEATAKSVGAERAEFVDVDQCEVGYVTIRLDGCSVCPVVVAIAVLPTRCDSYRVDCSCSCCCGC
jgi:hypothetical protein